MMQAIFVITEPKILHFLTDSSFSRKIGENPNVLTFCKEIFKTSIWFYINNTITLHISEVQKVSFYRNETER